MKLCSIEDILSTQNIISCAHFHNLQSSSRCLPDITLKLFLIQGASPYDIAIAAPRIVGVPELYDMLEIQAIGYCRALWPVNEFQSYIRKTS